MDESLLGQGGRAGDQFRDIEVGSPLSDAPSQRKVYNPAWVALCAGAAYPLGAQENKLMSWLDLLSSDEVIELEEYAKLFGLIYGACMVGCVLFGALHIWKYPPGNSEVPGSTSSVPIISYNKQFLHFNNLFSLKIAALGVLIAWSALFAGEQDSWDEIEALVFKIILSMLGNIEGFAWHDALYQKIAYDKDLFQAYLAAHRNPLAYLLAIAGGMATGFAELIFKYTDNFAVASVLLTADSLVSYLFVNPDLPWNQWVIDKVSGGDLRGDFLAPKPDADDPVAQAVAAPAPATEDHDPTGGGMWPRAAGRR